MRILFTFICIGILLPCHAQVKATDWIYIPKYYPSSDFTPFEDLKSGKIKPEEIKRLSVSDSTLTKIPDEIYQCHNLRQLEFVHTTIARIPHKLQKLKKLSVLIIKDNHPENALRISRNSHIRIAQIEGNADGLFPKKYSRWRALDSLQFWAPEMQHFPDIYGNRRLQKLSVKGSKLTLTDLRKRKIKNLRELDLTGNAMTSVPDRINIFTHLERLKVCYNQISEVSKEIGKLTKLRELSFYQNNLVDIPEGLCNLTSLKELDLYYNSILRVETDITKMTSLEVLYLSHNKIFALPENLGDLPALEELYLSDNRISDLPSSLNKLQQLRIFRIDENYLTNFPDFVLNLPDVSTVDVGANHITKLPGEILKMPKLSVIVFSENPLEMDLDTLGTMITKLKSKGVSVHHELAPDY